MLVRSSNFLDPTSYKIVLDQQLTSEARIRMTGSVCTFKKKNSSGLLGKMKTQRLVFDPLYIFTSSPAYIQGMTVVLT